MHVGITHLGNPLVTHLNSTLVRVESILILWRLATANTWRFGRDPTKLMSRGFTPGTLMQQAHSVPHFALAKRQTASNSYRQLPSMLRVTLSLRGRTEVMSSPVN